MNTYRIMDFLDKEELVCTKLNNDIVVRDYNDDDIEFSLFGIYKKVDWSERVTSVFVYADSVQNAIANYFGFKRQFQLNQFEKLLDDLDIKSSYVSGRNKTIENDIVVIPVRNEMAKEYFAYPHKVYAEHIEPNTTKLWVSDYDPYYVFTRDFEKLKEAIFEK